MRYKVKVYALYEGEVETTNEAAARIQAENDMICELSEFFHPKVKIMVKLEEQEAKRE